jgi:DNA-binding transcriptional LysR family regulator
MDEAINWHDMEILHAVLQQRSFSEAARALGLSQPTVSRHIDALERALGRELFVRTTSGLEPSDLALSLGEHARDMSDSMFAIERVLDGEQALPEGIVTLGLPYGFGGLPMALALQDLHQHYPGLSIDLKAGPPENDLGHRETDIDVRWEKPSQADLITRSMGSIHFGLYATESYIARHGCPEAIGDLREHMFPFVEPALMSEVLASLKRAGAEPRHFPFRCSGNTMLSLLLGNQGLTLAMAPCGLQDPHQRRLCPDYHWEAPILWLTMHAGLRRNAPIRAVWDWLVGRLPAVIEASHEA